MTPETRAEQTHQALRDDLKAYADGELTLPRRLVVRRHLSGCAACREEIDVMQLLRDELRSTEPTGGLDPALKARILSQVAAVPPLPAPRRPDRLLRYGFAASVAVSLAFAAILLRTGVFTGRPLPAPTQEVTPVSPSAHQSLPAPVASSAPTRAVASGGAVAADGTASKPAAPARIVKTPMQVARVPKPAPAAAAPPAQAKVTAAFPAPGEAPYPMAEAQRKMRAHSAPSEPTASDTIMPETPRLKAVDAGAGMPKATEPPRIAAQSNQPLPAPPSPPVAPPPAAPPETSTVPRLFAGQPDALPATAPPAAGFAPPMSARVSKSTVTDRETPDANISWPIIARPAGVAGAALKSTVEASWLVDAQGHATDIRFPSSGDAGVDKAIRDAIRNRRFAPATRQGGTDTARMSHTFVIAP